MTDRVVLTARKADAGERLDKFLVAQLGDRLTRAQLQALVRSGDIRVDDKPAKSGWRLKGSEMVVVLMPPPPPPDETVIAEDIPLNVLYEDADIAVIDKPAGLVVHPGAGVPTGTLVHALLARYPEIGQMRYAPQRRGIVHRLDRDTSGLIVIARNERAMHGLMMQFQRRTVDKVYLALLERPPKTPTGRIDAPLDRDRVNRRKMAVQHGGRPAVSEFSSVATYTGGFTLVRVRLLTGRTHQIRVHMAFIGAPIVGDRVYGLRKQRLALNRQFLHSAELSFTHPRTGERLAFESALPPELQAILDHLAAPQD